MNQLYQNHLEKLEEFMKRASMTPEQKMELYSIAESLLADGGFAYATAFAKDWKWPPAIETKLNTASNEIIEFSRELMRRQKEVADSRRKSRTHLEVVVSDARTKSE